MKLTDLIRPLFLERQLIGLTGGGDTKLDGVVTTALALSPVPWMSFVVGSTIQVYMLRVGTDAESSPTIIRPDDFNASTNAKVWQLIYFSGSLVVGNNLSDVANAPTALANLGGVNAAALATKQDASANLTSWSTLTPAGKQDHSLNLDGWSALIPAAKQNTLGFTPLNSANDLSDVVNAETARNNLGLIIGNQVQAWSVNLDGWSALSPGSIGGLMGYQLVVGANIKLDWNDSLTFDSSGKLSINWQFRLLKDSAESTTIDWQNKQLLDMGVRLDWSWLYLFDLAGTVALDWDHRWLKNAAGDTLLDWSGSTLVATGLVQTNQVGTVVQAFSTNLTSWSALAPSTKQNQSANLDGWSAIAPGTTGYLTSAAIGVTLQGWSTNLDAWSALAPSSKINTSAIGATVQAFSTNLTSWSALAPTAKQDATVNLTSWSALAPAAKQDALGFTPLNAASNLSDAANLGTVRTNLGLVIGTTVQAYSVNLTSWAALAPAAKQDALGFTPLNAASNLSDVGSSATVRTNLGLVIGTNVQAYNANLTSWAALAPAAKQDASANLTAWSALAPSAKQDALGFTPLNAASNLSDAANLGTVRTNLGLVIGTNVQAFSTNLTGWAGITTASKLDLAGGTLTGALTGTLVTMDRFINTQSALTYAATTNIDFDLLMARTISLTGNVTFTTSNKAAGKMKKFRIICDATARTFTFPVGWTWIGTAPTGIAASKTGILTLECWGTLDTDIVAAYADSSAAVSGGGDMLKANNLSDLSSIPAALANLGLTAGGVGEINAGSGEPEGIITGVRQGQFYGNLTTGASHWFAGTVGTKIGWM